MPKVIYLDNHATTPCDARVVEKMLPFFTENFGNSASRSHPLGQLAQKELEKAREQVAALLNSSPQEIIFTSGATESINMGIWGVAKAYKDKGNHIITQATEHKAVLYSIEALKQEGYEVTVLPVDAYGLIDLDELKNSITPKTILIAIMSANNEIGTLQPTEEIGKIAKERGILYFCDAVQSVGKIPTDVEKMSIDLLSLSAHKIHGPKGIGALYLRKNPRVRFTPTVFGGGQEKGLRSGTVNVPGAIGLGEACNLARTELKEESLRMQTLSRLLKETICKRLDGVKVNGHPTLRLANNVSLSFEGIDGEEFFRALWGKVAASAGATCTSTSIKPSHVLTAIGLTPEFAKNTVRFGLGRENTESEVKKAAEVVIEAVNALRNQRELGK